MFEIQNQNGRILKTVKSDKQSAIKLAQRMSLTSTETQILVWDGETGELIFDTSRGLTVEQRTSK